MSRRPSGDSSGWVFTGSGWEYIGGGAVHELNLEGPTYIWRGAGTRRPESGGVLILTGTPTPVAEQSIVLSDVGYDQVPCKRHEVPSTQCINEHSFQFEYMNSFHHASITMCVNLSSWEELPGRE